MNKFFELRADNEESVSTVHRHRSKVILCNSSHFLYTNIKISCCLLDGEHILLTNRKRFIAFCIHSISPSDKVVTQLTPLYYFFFFVIFLMKIFYFSYKKYPFINTKRWEAFLQPPEENFFIFSVNWILKNKKTLTYSRWMPYQNFLILLSVTLIQICLHIC